MVIKNYFLCLNFIIFLLLSCDVFNIDGDEGMDNFVRVDIVETYVISLETNKVKKLVDGNNVTFIQNSNSFVYSDSNAINKTAINNTNIEVIAEIHELNANDYFELTISPDGDNISFPERVDGTYDLFLVNLSTKNVVNLTNSNDAWEENPVFSNNGSKLLFKEITYKSINDHTKDSEGISIIDIDSNNHKKILHNTLPSFFPIFLSDDNFIITFGYFENQEIRLYKINLANYNYEFFSLGYGRIFSSPAMTQDFKLFYSLEENNIYTFDLSTNEIKLVYSGFIGRDYSFSYDFSQVVFIKDGIKVVNFETGQTTELFSDSEIKKPDFPSIKNWDANISCPQFSPDGNNVIFVKRMHVEYFK